MIVVGNWTFFDWIEPFASIWPTAKLNGKSRWNVNSERILKFLQRLKMDSKMSFCHSKILLIENNQWKIPIKLSTNILFLSKRDPIQKYFNTFAFSNNTTFNISIEKCSSRFLYTNSSKETKRKMETEREKERGWEWENEERESRGKNYTKKNRLTECQWSCN